MYVIFSRFAVNIPIGKPSTTKHIYANLAGCNHRLDAVIQTVSEILTKRVFLADIEVVLYLINHIVRKPHLIQEHLGKHYIIRLFYESAPSVNDSGHSNLKPVKLIA